MGTRLPSVLLVVLVCAAFWPGIYGGFLFDDFANLPDLGAYGRVDNLQTLLLYLTSGKADPVGRPLALLTFLIDARDWPASALSFKVTNILIHALNAALLFALIRQLELRLDNHSASASRCAFFAAAFWALHPLMLSTTLYIVQRQTLLAGTFVLTGLLLWTAARARFDRQQTRTGWLLALGAVPGCLVLALLCKASGVLLPLLLCTLEVTVLRGGPRAAARPSRWLLLGLPAVTLLAWLAVNTPGFAQTAAGLRPWSLAERLMTQPGILLDYLRLLLLPRSMTAGLFQDGMAHISRLDFKLAAVVVFWFMLLLIAFRLRRRQPVFALAVLFFLAGHLLEASVVPLELYFEHRNYVPALLLFWPVARWLGGDGEKARWRQAAGLAAVAMLLCVTHLGARTWGDTYQLAQTWALLAPHSGRAQTFAARQDLQRDNFDAAERRLTRWITLRPDDLQAALALADLHCETSRYGPRTESMLSTALGAARQGSTLGFEWLMRRIDDTTTGSCPGQDLAALQRLYVVFESNVHLRTHLVQRQQLAHLRGKLALARGDLAAAAADFERNLRLRPRPALALSQAALLANAGYPESGLAHLRLFEQLYSPQYRPWSDMTDIHAWLLQKTDYWAREISVLEADLGAAATRQEPDA